MQSDEALKNLGFTEHEAVVYTALLQLGPSPVLKIATGAGLKRPTTYLILDELLKKGAIAVVPKEKKKQYIALSPERIAENAARKIADFQKALPELLALWKSESVRPAIQFFESGEGILNVYREITGGSGIKEVRTFFTFEAIPEEFASNYEMFSKLFESGKVAGREIISTETHQHYYLKRGKRFKNYQVRFIGSDTKFFSDTIVYGNKIAILSFKKRFALIIESEDVANSFKSLFELAWRSARV